MSLIDFAKVISVACDACELRPQEGELKMIYKFRAWDKEANIMIYSDHRTRKLYDVYYGFEMNGQGELECRWEGEFTESHVLDGGTLDNVMPFTGFYDKYGEEIYAGDVLDYDEDRFVILWDEERGGFLIDYWQLDERYDFRDFWPTSKVIGNIYENPELLR